MTGVLPPPDEEEGGTIVDHRGCGGGVFGGKKVRRIGEGSAIGYRSVIGSIMGKREE